MSRSPKKNSTLSLAQRSNFSPLTAWGYSTWRRHSLSLLSGQAFPLAREAALFAALCPVRPGEAWLDAGTSTGFYAGLLARRGAQVLAVDLSPAMLAQARREQGRTVHSGTLGSGGTLHFAALNVESSGLLPGSFDGITVGATLNETHDPARFLRACAELLRPGGRLWLMYLPRTGGPLQAALSRPELGGLSFPDPAWVAGELPGLSLSSAFQVGAVRFELHTRP